MICVVVLYGLRVLHALHGLHGLRESQCAHHSSPLGD